MQHTKVKSIILITCFVCLTSFSGFGQHKNTLSKPSQPTFNRGTLYSLPSTGTATPTNAGGFAYSVSLGTEGSIFLSEQWKEGTAVLKDGTVLEDRKYRYNIYAQQMQFIHGEDTLAFAVPEELRSLSFDGRTFIFEEFDDVGTVKKGYVEVLASGPCKLMLRRAITYHILDNDHDNVNEESFILEHSYFLKKSDKLAKRIPMNKRGVRAAFCDRKEISAFIKKEKLKFRDHDDLIRVVNYYNSLEEL